MGNHTPTPYQLVESRSVKDKGSLHIACNTHVVMGKVFSQEVGDFIVRACNAHDALVEALEDIASASRLEYRDNPGWVIDRAKEALDALASLSQPSKD